MSGCNDNPFPTLMGIVKEGFQAYLASSGAGAAPAPLQQQLMPFVMGFAGGDWSFMDSVVPHFAPQLINFILSLGEGDLLRGVKVIESSVAAKVADTLSNNAMLSATLAPLCKGGANVALATSFNVGVLVERMILLIIHMQSGEVQGLFSENAKRIVKGFSGDWLEQISSLLVSGRDGIMNFLQALTGALTPQIVALFPQEISMYAMFATPMVLNMLMQFHQQFIKDKENEEAELYA